MAKEANTTTTVPQPETVSLEHDNELPEQFKTTHARRETLHQRTEGDDASERLALTRAEFQYMLKDPENLYEEILELIRTRPKILRSYMLPAE
jgi:hypothetical protein